MRQCVQVQNAKLNILTFNILTSALLYGAMRHERLVFFYEEKILCPHEEGEGVSFRVFRCVC